MKAIFLSLFLVLSLPNLINAQDAEYKELLSKYFQASGSEQTFEVAIKQTVRNMKGQASGLDDATWDELENEFLSTSMNDLVTRLMPVYQNYLSKDDLRAIIEFYESRVGKKLAANTPLITQESMQVGSEWGMELGQKVMKRIEEKKNR